MKLKVYDTLGRLHVRDIIFLEEIPTTLASIMREHKTKLSAAWLKVKSTSFSIHLPTGSCSCEGCKKRLKISSDFA